MAEAQCEPTLTSKQKTYGLIMDVLCFRRTAGMPRCTPDEIVALCPALDVNGTATRLPEMKKRGFPIACGRREGTRKKEWWLV